MKTSRRIALIIITIISSFQFAFSQTKNQHTLLQEIGEGSVFKTYYGIVKEGNKYSAQGGSECEIKFENNINNKFSVFKLTKVGTTEVLINCGFGFLKPNHYTEPSVIHSKSHKLAYIYIDGLLYGLKSVPNPNNIENIVIENIYVLMKPAKGEHTSGKVAAKAIKTRDHEAVIKQYLSEMKSIQEKATANFSPEILAEIDAVENKNSADKKAIKDANDAYWLTDEGQRILAARKAKENSNKSDGDGYVTIKNVGKQTLDVITEAGTSSHISPGSTSKWPCHTNIYYCFMDSHNTYNVKGNLIANGKENCGKTVSASGSK